MHRFLAADPPPALLRALERAARAFADELHAQLQAAPAGMTEPDTREPYSQDSLPPGIMRRPYLDAARRGDFPTSKIGRLVLCRVADWEAFAATRKTTPRRKRVDERPVPANDTPSTPKLTAHMTDRELHARAGVPLRAVPKAG